LYSGEGLVDLQNVIEEINEELLDEHIKDNILLP